MIVEMERSITAYMCWCYRVEAFQSGGGPGWWGKSFGSGKVHIGETSHGPTDPQQTTFPFTLSLVYCSGCTHKGVPYVTRTRPTVDQSINATLLDTSHHLIRS